MVSIELTPLGRRLFNPVIKLFNRPPVDPAIHNPYAKACMPDDLIVAHLIESFAKNMKDWKLYSKARPSRWEPWEMQLTNRATGFFILSRYNHKKKDRYEEEDTKSPKIYGPCVIKRGVWAAAGAGPFMATTEVTLSEKASAVLRNEYNRLKTLFDKAEAVAADAKKAMEENEKKWDLAESLLGMKRNKFGALVPVRTAEETPACKLCGGGAIPCSECRGE